ncbi:MAG: RluA family pseudouridine synthase [Flavobacteriales bacterium]|nr:RluA family pseudouridine synthase [Flavobacteriales bacterium]
MENWNVKSAILFEDNHLIAINKPAGLLVHDELSYDKTLTDYVKEYIKTEYDKPGDVFLGVIHRIDRPVSGLVIFAKTSKALTRMNELFKEKKLKKIYYALVQKKPQKLSDDLTHWLVKNKEKNVTKAYDKEVKDSKKSQLSYDYIGTANHKFLLKIYLHTGRSHQIRAQLAKIGYPISGDLKYGSWKGKGNYIYLHSKSLEFIHPVKKEKLLLQCPLPNEENWNFFQSFE